MGHVEGGIMDEDAQAHIKGEISSSEWQCGPLGTTQNVCGPIISRVEVVEDNATLTTDGRMAWTGKTGRILHDS